MTFLEAVEALVQDYRVPGTRAAAAVEVARRLTEKAEPVEAGYVVIRFTGSGYAIEPHTR
jgi:hypothetical protein